MSVVTINANSSFAQDYIDLQQDGAVAGELAASVTSCRHYGYETNEREVTRLVDQRIRQAIMDGVDGETASNIMADAIRRKGADLAFLNEGVAHEFDASRSAAELGRLLADWQLRCRRMSRRFPTAIVADGDEDRVTEAFLRSVENQLSGNP